MARVATPFVNLNIDLSPLAHYEGFTREYFKQVDSPISKRELTSVTHSIFAEKFDHHMRVWATAHKAHFAHVYEYAVSGDPYRLVGNRKAQLWVHTKRYVDDGSWIATFKFMPAKNPSPTYRQRRRSKVGQDPIRDIDKKDFDKLVSKSHHRDTHAYRFVWKAPMLEYNIPRRVSPQAARMLFLPSRGFHSPMSGAAGAGWRFTTSYVVTQQEPGNSAGMFTAQWLSFWGGITSAQFDAAVGRATKKAIRDHASGASTYKAVSKGKRKVQMTMPADLKAAEEHGKAQAREAAQMYRRRLQTMNWSSQWILGENRDVSW